MLFRPQKPFSHYKRSSRSLFRLWGPSREHLRGHIPVVIGLVQLSCTTCSKTKLRELSFWHVVSLHRCSTFRFLAFNNDFQNHSRTLITARFLRKNSQNRPEQTRTVQTDQNRPEKTRTDQSSPSQANYIDRSMLLSSTLLPVHQTLRDSGDEAVGQLELIPCLGKLVTFSADPI